MSCRLTGFRVQDGNTWWYEVASAPWNNQFYAPADNFFNNGQSSGSLSGTPFVDTAVPVCGAPALPPPPPPPPPTVPQPTGVTATADANNDVTVRWNAVPGASGYYLYLDGQRLLKVQVLSFDYGNLLCGTTHIVGVQTIGSDGTTTSAITTTTVSTPSCNGGQPLPSSLPAPTGLSATFTAAQHLVLTWSPVTGATSYNVYLNGGFVTRVATTSYDFGAVDCGKAFSPGAQSFAGGGQVSNVASITVTSPACAGAPPDSTPPSAPTNLTEDFPGNTSFTIDWGQSSDDVGVVGYNIFLNGNKVATVGSGDVVPSLGHIGYVFNGLTCGTTYQVGVSAYDTAGNVSPEATLNASTTACPSALPAPTGVHATVAANNDVVLAWNAVAGVTTYNLWLNGQDLLTAGAVTSFDYGQLTCGKTFTLGVQSAANGQVSTVSTIQISTNPC